jgi:hypothetical protein
MGLNKTRLIAGILGTNSLVSYDSDLTASSYSKGSSGESASTSVYTSIDDLPASAEDGTKALITSTNKLYLYSGSGWYNIALVNTTPYWSTESNSSYSLNINGTSTTVTVLATDPEGTPITYTAVTDSDFDSIATVTRDSDNGRTFIITPIDSDNGPAVGGTGTVTFKASDGVNLVQSLSTFSLLFAIYQSSYTTMLLKADSDGNDNQIDASPSGRAITEVGGVNSTAFTPYHPGGYSGWSYGSGGSGDVSYLIPQGVNDSATFGTGDFTIESWVYTFSTTKQQFILDQRPSGNTGDYITILTTGGQLRVYMQTADVIAASVNTAIAANVWVHVAIVRHNNVLKMYIDGVEKGSATSNHNISSNPTSRPVIARNGHGTGYAWDGYLSDFRIVKSAVYTSAFTPPTERLTAISNTSLLLYTGEPYLEDKSTNDWPLEWSTNHGLKRFSRFDYLGYSKSVHGGSVYWDGNGDQLQAANSNDLDPGSGDMTWEFWCYPTTANANSTIACRWHITQGRSWLIYAYNSDRVGISFKVGGSQYSCGIVMSMKNTWNHVAIVKNASDNTTKIWVNGKLKNTIGYGSSTWLDSTGPMSIGFNLDNAPASWYYGGYIQDFNMTKRALYTDSEFSVPTSIVTLDSDCKISTSTNRHSVYDIATGTELTNSGALATNNGAKWTQETAIHFNDANDYLQVPFNDLVVNTEDFTYEFWFNPTSGTWLLQPTGWNEGNNRGFWLTMNDTTKQLRLFASNGTWNTFPEVTQSSNNVYTNGVWQHVAFCRDNGIIKLFVDGIEDSDFTIAYATSLNLAGTSGSHDGGNIEERGLIGARIADGTVRTDGFIGYMQDFRITKGVSRYSSNFTPPTGPLLG